MEIKFSFDQKYYNLSFQMFNNICMLGILKQLLSLDTLYLTVQVVTRDCQILYSSPKVRGV